MPEQDAHRQHTNSEAGCWRSRNQHRVLSVSTFALKLPASKLCSQRKIGQSIVGCNVPASAQARFRFSIRPATLSA